MYSKDSRHFVSPFEIPNEAGLGKGWAGLVMATTDLA